MTNATQCDTLDYREFDRFHREYYLPNRPVVIRGVRDAMTLEIHRWSGRYLEQLMGETLVPVLTTTTGFLSYERNVSPMTFSAFAALALGESADRGTRYYYKNPTSLLPQGHDDSDLIEGFRPYISKAMSRNLWISGPGLTVGLHFDPAENFNMQLCGHKAFYLYPPGTLPYYPLPMFSQTAHISGVFRNGPDPDLTQFPRFDPKSGVRVDLRAGDVLYIPAYWWHQVQSLGNENVNLNFWWLPALSKQVRNWNQALRGHAQLALRLLKFGNITKAPAASHEPHVEGGKLVDAGLERAARMKDLRDELTAGDVERLRREYDAERMRTTMASAVSAPYPPLGRWNEAIETTFYDDGNPLAPIDRERCLIAILTLSGAPLSLAIHVYWGLMEGMSVAEICHTIGLAASYGGVPRLAHGMPVTYRTLGVLRRQLEAGSLSSEAILGALVQDFANVRL